jgi:hypothetical protein
LELNVGKCKSITFSRPHHPVEFSHMLRGIFLDRVNSTTDLGVVMDSRMSYWYYGWKGFGNAGVCEKIVR